MREIMTVVREVDDCPTLEQLELEGLLEGCPFIWTNSQDVARADHLPGRFGKLSCRSREHQIQMTTQIRVLLTRIITATPFFSRESLTFSADIALFEYRFVQQCCGSVAD